MKVLFTARASLFSQPGGDTRQVEQTAEALRDIDVEVDIKLRGESIDLKDYQIIHFFNAGRPADITGLIPQITQPLVVSSIWVDYSEWDSMRGGLSGSLNKILGTHGMEYVKTLARGLNGSDRFPGASYLFQGHRKTMDKLLGRANAIIASSHSEKERLARQFDTGSKTEVIPLGLPLQLIRDQPDDTRSGVIAVGRIEGLKNQLNLINAAKGASWNLQIIGKQALNQHKYHQACLKEAPSNVEFTGWLDSEHLLDAYQQAKVLVLPSYFETFGLVALEALANGCNVVLSNRPDMNDVFKNKALFCNPNDPADIRQKIDEALLLPPYQLSQTDKELYTWSSVAKQLIKTYQTLLQ